MWKRVYGFENLGLALGDSSYIFEYKNKLYLFGTGDSYDYPPIKLPEKLIKLLKLKNNNVK